MYGLTAENVAKYAGKGSAISVRGRVINRTLDFPGGQTIRTIGIIGEQVSFIQTKAPGSGADDETTDPELGDLDEASIENANNHVEGGNDNGN